MRTLSSEYNIRPFRVVGSTAIQEDARIAERNTVPRMVTIKEATKLTGLSYPCLRRWCLEGRIVHIKTGKKYLINYDKLLGFMNTGV